MITVLPEKDTDLIKSYFKDNSLEFCDNSGVVTAKSGEEVLGYCIYYLDNKGMEILKLFPEDDLLLADGILRSTIHVACERFVMNITYSKSSNEQVFKQLGFIKSEAERTLNADKLFGGCSCQDNGTAAKF